MSHVESDGTVYCFGFFNQYGHIDYSHPVKIGFTRDLESRLNSFRQSHWREPKLIASTPGTMALERALHFRFRELSAGREWFWWTFGMETLMKLVSAGRIAEVLDETMGMARLEKWIAHNTISSAGAANKIGFCPTALSRLRRKNKIPSPKLRHRIADITNNAVPYCLWEPFIRPYPARMAEKARSEATTERHQPDDFINWEAA